jgi:Zn-dependent protease with chaperone function
MEKEPARPPEHDEAGGKPAGAKNSRVSFPEISYRAYEHPLALAAMATMRRIKGFDAALAAMNRVVGEPIIRMQYLASAVRVGPRQFSSLHAIKEEAVEILDFDDAPELYVCNIGGANAFTMGINRPFIVVTASLLDLMDENELRFVIGHELGHALSGHALYHSMAHVLATGTGLISSFPIAGAAAEGIEAGLREWRRKSELSCDRAGLLVSQDVTAAIGALMKLAAGSRAADMNAEEFLHQATEFELDIRGIRNRIYKFLIPRETHPIVVLRAAELDRWVRTGGYATIVEEGQYELRSEDDQTSTSSTFRSAWDKAKETRQQRIADRTLRRTGQAPG